MNSKEEKLNYQHSDSKLTNHSIEMTCGPDKESSEHQLRFQRRVKRFKELMAKLEELKQRDEAKKKVSSDISKESEPPFFTTWDFWLQIITFSKMVVKKGLIRLKCMFFNLIGRPLPLH
ncbi:hypothetical protein O181_078249 [Austropuccinia psidii MF-1]|uniref:Uncharacterized protein n=1 Tax=Austropuccinia psidii MF-1 TaxID=1389203 RepID=A0A9Q3FGJ7_9BASI|nr:hypothetical protein [Austropuccinia psidii MF-1]